MLWPDVIHCSISYHLKDELGDMHVFQVIKLYLELYKMRSIPLVNCINDWLNLVPITIWMVVFISCCILYFNNVSMLRLVNTPSVHNIGTASESILKTWVDMLV